MKCRKCDAIGDNGKVQMQADVGSRCGRCRVERRALGRSVGREGAWEGQGVRHREGARRIAGRGREIGGDRHWVAMRRRRREGGRQRDWRMRARGRRDKRGSKEKTTSERAYLDAVGVCSRRRPAAAAEKGRVVVITRMEMDRRRGRKERIKARRRGGERRDGNTMRIEE